MNPWHIVDGKCIKRKFGTQFSALRFGMQSGGAKFPYLCSYCDSWHLSSYELIHPTLTERPAIEAVERTEHPDAEFWAKRIKKRPESKIRRKKYK